MPLFRARDVNTDLVSHTRPARGVDHPLGSKNTLRYTREKKTGSRTRMRPWDGDMDLLVARAWQECVRHPVPSRPSSVIKYGVGFRIKIKADLGLSPQDEKRQRMIQQEENDKVTILNDMEKQQKRAPLSAVSDFGRTRFVFEPHRKRSRHHTRMEASPHVHNDRRTDNTDI
ncbi:hypothetical protein C8Q74DRAFT_1219098 [Fomes fomentarius]|nr:hypothetical protein C8Q74DRAFT_1219098 [Fomes fomentarius]